MESQGETMNIPLVGGPHDGATHICDYPKPEIYFPSSLDRPSIQHPSSPWSSLKKHTYRLQCNWAGHPYYVHTSVEIT